MGKWDDIEKHHDEIVARLKAERKNQNLSHEKLAAKSGLSIRAVGMIESGERKPTLFNCLRLAKALDTDLKDML